jgi:DNA-binding response OmpR family regulator
MKSILIAETSPSIAASLVDALQDRYIVHTCANGNTALAGLEDLRPDALIINLALADVDGLTVLARAVHTPPVILALTNFISNEVTVQAVALGVGCIFLVPCSIKALTDRLERMFDMLPI